MIQMKEKLNGDEQGSKKNGLEKKMNQTLDFYFIRKTTY